ncbi:chromatin remodelling complex Rsc7/Swp82 subunit-domain-containing protein [Cokeromyces recurvatus]|uniref:chromatin remodelling complex Rsc7/Swp82 subunit-domain-containing protein n=1 Tax=Cokeromyces recurvatus TaxID=90255 RepID=UPI00221E8C65|nr:chromatin remodelling complex Rsc7/Swp82 subunit-domain-containing protein [Cokeromyces recurvatus]KAI7903816.1 chromatin remodelling complex Rsc7/Swp82 subunit-domain-containing protein [Cokeromyces recurvatus]
MPSGNEDNVLHKSGPKRKRSRSRSGGLDPKDDLNYVDDESDLSSGDDTFTLSDLDVHPSHDEHNSNQHHTPSTGRKRGRPKASSAREDRRHRSTTISSTGAAHGGASSVSASSQTYGSPATPSNTGYVSDIDETGETKIDKFGRLKEGREYRVPTFTLPTRDETLFMFSKDPAALLGFRDSFVFLKKNVNLVKVHIDAVEKGYLVDSNMLRSTFRTREISVVTARSVFKQFGHRIIKRGRKGRDDYYYTDEVDDGEEEQSDEETFSASFGKDFSENKPTPASAFLPSNTNTTNINTTTTTNNNNTNNNNATNHLAMNTVATLDIGRNNLSHKPTAQDSFENDLNWMHNAAVSTRQFNTSLFNYRRTNPTQYDLLTNVYQIPVSRQTLIDHSLLINTQSHK